ncbi:GreA/GreB family elongation factor [Marinobacterium rhizophilum]|uniref:GreA/GreB family elongation factor n=1 Tax=Marinobacterium rhizophilum TaxID=420402 RepID=A0ABY5HL44_9GAMM|nr:GreA/GreB family elongation factor [Marinobacterium rhizophilum]UTW12303.1 GreA/GreB family elongation factor [Marinobacterium rhizophilum]
MNCRAPVSFKRISERLSYYFLAEEGFSYTSPLNLLLVFSKLEQCRRSHSGPLASVRPGSSVLVKLLQTGEKSTLMLVNPAQAAPSLHRISVLSPLGSALLGRLPGETCKVEYFGSVLDFELLSILNE